MQLQHKGYLPSLLLFLGFMLWQAPLSAESSAEALCERLYSDSLNKAKQALAEGKRDEALRFLLEAATITERCANSSEPNRGRRPEENVLSSAPSMDQTSARVFL
jgi:hypothetical protein